MTDQYVPALRQRFLEDMQIKGLQPKTQTMYLRGMRDFTGFLGHAPDTATPEELRAFQLDMKRARRWCADLQQPTDGAEFLFCGDVPTA